MISDWPQGTYRPVVPLPYAGETQNGYEYQAAILMIQEGLVEEGLTAVAAIRDRYDGARRNPWNEFECGSNYARSMAAWSLLPTFSGFEYDMVHGMIGFDPLQAPEEGYRTVWSLDCGWGTFAVAPRRLTLALLAGELTLSRLRVPSQPHRPGDRRDAAFRRSGGALHAGAGAARRRAQRGVPGPGDAGRGTGAGRGVRDVRAAAIPLDLRLGLTDAADVAHPLRWGIIGTGSISAQWVASLAACPGATVSAVAARDPERARRFAEQHAIATVCDTYAELAASPEVDIVYVGTITGLHREHTLLALAAGKHVLCEKPLAEHAADARAMYEAADARGVMLQDGMWTRYFPAVEHAGFLIEEGVIGEVVLVQSDFFDPIYAIQAAPLGFGGSRGPPRLPSPGATQCRRVGVRHRPLCGDHLPAAGVRIHPRPPRSSAARGGSPCSVRPTVRPGSPCGCRKRAECPPGIRPTTCRRRRRCSNTRCRGR